MSKNNLVVKLKQNNITLEVLTIPGSMKSYREGNMKLESVLVVEEVFSNSSKFQKAKNTDLKKCCGVTDKMEAIKIILDQGTFPLNKKEMQEMVTHKKDEIINYIHKYYHDPRPEIVIPHPVSRIESALDNMKVRIDPFQSTDQQIREIIKRMPEFLPIKPMSPPHETSFEEIGRGVKKGGKKGGKRR